MSCGCTPGSGGAAFSDRGLQILVVPGGEILGIVEDLANYLTAGFGIAPELALDQDKVAIGRHEQDVDRPGRRLQLQADRDQGDQGRLDLLDWQEIGMAVNQLLQPAFRIGARLAGVEM